MADSFFSSLKKERIKKRIDPRCDLALPDIADYIDTLRSTTGLDGTATLVVSAPSSLKTATSVHDAERARESVSWHSTKVWQLHSV